MYKTQTHLLAAFFFIYCEFARSDQYESSERVFTNGDQQPLDHEDAKEYIAQNLIRALQEGPIINKQIFYEPRIENWCSVGGPYGDATFPKEPAGSLIVGNFKVIRSEDNILYLVADLSRDLQRVAEYLIGFDGNNKDSENKKRESYNRHYFLPSSFSLKEGENYSFSCWKPMKVVKRIKKRVFEVEVPSDLRTNRQVALDREEARSKAINDAAKATSEARRQVKEQKESKINSLLSTSSLQSALHSAESAKKDKQLVFKNLYIGMTSSDALWVLKELLCANFKVKDGTDFESPKHVKIAGKIEVFVDPPGRNSLVDVLDRTYRNPNTPLNPKDELRKDELYDSRCHMDLYFDNANKIVFFSIPRYFLNKLFSISAISDQQFFEMFKSNYNISGEMAQVDLKQDNVLLTLLSDKFAPQFSTTFSLIDPRGIKIDFVMPTGSENSSTLILQKWATPKEINDSFD
jgi:hypothetical protein